MAKARVNVKGVSKAVDRLTKDLKNLQKKPGVQAPAAEMQRLHKRLTSMKALLNECPDPMFQMFEMAARPAAKPARKRKTRKTR